MYIKTFGKFEIVELKNMNFSPKEVEIIIFIISKNGFSVSTNKIIDEVWNPNENLPTLNNLTVYFSNINKKLKNKGKIKTKNSISYFEAKDLKTDFNKFVLSTNKFFSDPSNQKAANEAFEVYSGEFLPGISSNWVLTTRYYYEDLYFELIKLLVEKEKSKIKRFAYLKKIIDVGNNFENILEILKLIHENEKNYKSFIDENIFELIHYKDKLLREPRFIALLIIFENQFKILNFLRKGDFVSKVSENKFKLLLEKNKTKDTESEFNFLIKRLKKEGAKIKKVGIIN